MSGRAAGESGTSGSAPVLDSALSAVAQRAAYAPDHSGKIASLSRRVAREMELTDAQVEQAGELARVHDLGKTGIPAHILRKTTPLSPREMRALRWHPKIGADLVAEVPKLAHLAPYVHAAHERWDGSGYPDGLQGIQIPLLSRIVHACDAFVALLAERPYRQALDPEVVRDVFERNSGSQFCPDVAAALLRVVKPAPPLESVREVGPVPDELVARVPDPRPEHPDRHASRVAARVARRDPRRTATIVYTVGALVGVAIALMIALPVESVNDRCPPAGEGLVQCQVQKIGMRLSLLFLLVITCTTAIAHFVTFTAPSLYMRWRSGEFKNNQQAFPEDDPVLVAAHWGFVSRQHDRSRFLGKYRFDRRGGGNDIS